jgi:bifunctional non-homologous end joining protein LigD
MLAVAGDLPVGQGWGLEFKWDGVRAVAYVEEGRVRVLSRNDLEVTTRYPELAELGRLLPGRRVVLDGEIVALDDAARPSFARLQERMHARPAQVRWLMRAVPVAFLAFDVLHLDDWPLLSAPYELRRAELADLRLDRAGSGRVAVPPHMVGENPPDVLAAATGRGLEGVLAKRLRSPYRPGVRSRDWVKARVQHVQEVVVIGWRPGHGRREGTIGSLLFAVPDAAGGELRFAGHVGTGFTEAALRHLAERLEPLRRATAPVGGRIPPEHTRDVVWVEPLLVGEVAYATWAPDGLLRHPSWRGLRPDRQPGQVRREP